MFETSLTSVAGCGPWGRSEYWLQWKICNGCVVSGSYYGSRISDCGLMSPMPLNCLFCSRAPSTISRLLWLWLSLLSPRDYQLSSRHALHLEHAGWPRRMPLCAACPPLRHSAVRRSSALIRREPWRRIRCLFARSETSRTFVRIALFYTFERSTKVLYNLLPAYTGNSLLLASF